MKTLNYIVTITHAQESILKDAEISAPGMYEAGKKALEIKGIKADQFYLHQKTMPIGYIFCFAAIDMAGKEYRMFVRLQK